MHKCDGMNFCSSSHRHVAVEVESESESDDSENDSEFDMESVTDEEPYYGGCGRCYQCGGMSTHFYCTGDLYCY